MLYAVIVRQADKEVRRVDVVRKAYAEYESACLSSSDVSFIEVSVEVNGTPVQQLTCATVEIINSGNCSIDPTEEDEVYLWFPNSVQLLAMEPPTTCDADMLFTPELDLKRNRISLRFDKLIPGESVVLTLFLTGHLEHGYPRFKSRLGVAQRYVDATRSDAERLAYIIERWLTWIFVVISLAIALALSGRGVARLLQTWRGKR